MTSRAVIAIAVATIALSTRVDAQTTAPSSSVSCARHEVGARTSHSLAYDVRAQRVMMFGGIKVETEMGWFAARPSGTEDVCKIYAESFRDAAHLKRIQNDAQAALARLA